MKKGLKAIFRNKKEAALNQKQNAAGSGDKPADSKPATGSTATAAAAPAATAAAPAENKPTDPTPAKEYTAGMLSSPISSLLILIRGCPN